MGRRRRRLPVVVLALFLLGFGLSTFHTAHGQPFVGPIVVDGWTLLGPPGGTPPTAIAVAPDWPVDRFLVGVGGHQVTLTRDGGSTWERVLQPGLPGMRDVVVGSDGRGGHVLFATASQTTESPDGVLWRSADDGENWARLFDVPGWFGWRTGRQLRLSPTFGSDGTALVATDGRLLRSSDYGATWQEVDPVGQRIQQIEFSPAFATDRTIFAAAVVGPLAFPPPGAPVPAAHNEQSAGIVVSRDGGATWQVTSVGLEIDGVPFRHVQSLTVSPTYAQDGTVLALSWGPIPRDNIGYFHSRWPATLFRSTDGGRSWTAVRHDVDLTRFAEAAVRRAEVTTVSQVFARFAMSPRFAEDRTMILAQNWSDGRRAGCKLLRTTDGGDSWDQFTVPGAWRAACEQPVLVSEVGMPVAYLLTHTDTGWSYWFRSPNGGAIWERGDAPGNPLRPGYRVAPAAFAADGTTFMARQEVRLPDGTQVDGIWMRGPSVPFGTSALPRCGPCQ
jgi:photosystem II stability/assembly factor-like uncharacterized protein